MKIKYILMVLVALCMALAQSALAQFDAFAGFRTTQVDSRNLAVLALNLNSTTNAPVDIHGYEGIAKLDFFCFSNNVATTVLVAVQTSPDTTNWTTLANAAYATATSQIITNTYYGGVTGALATNIYNLPGTIVNPTASSSGWATPYLSAAPFTNTVSALDISHNGWVTIGFNIQDSQRYLRLVYTPSGTTTNWTGGAILTGKRQYMVP